MSQFTQPLIALPRRARRRAALLAAVLVLTVTTAVVLILAIDGDSSPAGPVGGKAHPAQHSNAATARDGFATAVSSQSLLPAGTSSPDESRVAASIAGR
jgi:hypothetical protein